MKLMTSATFKTIFFRCVVDKKWIWGSNIKINYFSSIILIIIIICMLVQIFIFIALATNSPYDVLLFPHVQPPWGHSIRIVLKTKRNTIFI